MNSEDTHKGTPEGITERTPGAILMELLEEFLNVLQKEPTKKTSGVTSEETSGRIPIYENV